MSWYQNIHQKEIAQRVIQYSVAKVPQRHPAQYEFRAVKLVHTNFRVALYSLDEQEMNQYLKHYKCLVLYLAGLWKALIYLHVRLITQLQTVVLR